MYAMGFVEAFVEIFNVNASVGIILSCGMVLFKMNKLDRNLMRARLFLNEAIMQRIWLYFLIAGSSFSINLLLRFALRFTAAKEINNLHYMVELTQIIFLITFLLAVYNWHIFISMSHQRPGSREIAEN